MRRALVLTIALVALGAQSALAWDPDANELDPGDQTEPDPVPFVVPEGIYLVTDVYAGDTVSRDGPTTTYSTVTVHDTPGTYARVLESVGTGQRSDLDGSSFNGRAALTDGRAVAGTYYEDFVLTPQGFVSVNIVFFQDDSITSAEQTTTQRPTAKTSDAPPPPPPPSGQEPTVVLPPSDDRRPPEQRSPRVGPDDRVDETTAASAGVALRSDGPILSSIEVLRGRQVSLWPRAFASGRAVAVRSWRIVAGTPDIASPTTGSGAEPCAVSWVTLAPAGSSFTVRFDVTSDAAPGRTLVAAITVTVRAPALLQ